LPIAVTVPHNCGKCYSYAKIVQQSRSEIQQALLRLQEQRGGYTTLIHRGKLALLKSEQQLKNIATEITTLTAEIAAAQTKINSLKLQIQQRVFRSPVDGILFQLPAREPGKVVQPGELIAQIAPQGTPLILKAQMPPTETGLMQVGMPVKVKFDAYPFQDYGVSEGRLHWVSPDSKVEHTPQGKVESFAVEVILDKPYVQEGKTRITLKSGQTAIAEIIVRERRVIDFVLDPFKKLQKTGIEL
jgi:HlyD family secretion protein